MSEVAIKVEDLSKLYQIGTKKSGSFRDTFSNLFKSKNNGKEGTEFWALRDVGFEIKRGEAVGIIGKNGAGKSTLLKILSRITEPSSGRIEINGRVSSLLEVGTGFHPELTGRENIFLNGTILGMTRREVKSKFDEIVDFSGVEKFIETPVKHYSSGMYVRLAFAVAAHLEPEILVVDEVLAVGDAEFQQKCLGKMEDVSKNQGRTVLFVSHNMGAVENLCSKGVLLQQGTCQFEGEIDDCIKRYLGGMGGQLNFNTLVNHKLNSEVEILEFHLNKNSAKSFEDLAYKIKIKSISVNIYSAIALLFYSQKQERVAIVDIRSQDLSKITSKSNVITVEGKIFDLPFIEGEYSIGLYLSSNLCTGNFYDLINLNISVPEVITAPYPVNVRGFVNLKNEFSIYE